METTVNKKEGFFQTITAKAVFIMFLTLALLIPGCMVQNLIEERQKRSEEAVKQINAKWGKEQTIVGVTMGIPYVKHQKDKEGRKKTEEGVWQIIPEEMNIEVKLNPEERYYGIYKTILYKSEVMMSGYFESFPVSEEGGIEYSDKNNMLLFGITDLKGITSNIHFTINGQSYTARPGEADYLKITLPDGLVSAGGRVHFTGSFQLKGSSGINFIPLGKNNQVKVEGNWTSPGFTGDYAADYTIDKDGFTASWAIMDFNRSLPEGWSGNTILNFQDAKFGVNLITPVDHYQKNMRSAKYALMFIALTFAVFFFVELLTHKQIHILQYLLVGLALIIFYALLLSISEQINFQVAYLIASVSTILLIVLYAQSIFRNKTQTSILALLLIGLYTFLYVILQLEDIALLIGSVGLFIILAIIMYFSRKINWYQPTLSA